MSLSNDLSAFPQQNSNGLDSTAGSPRRLIPTAWINVVGLVLLLIWIVAALVYSPIAAPYDLDYDEGVNLAKADLLGAGYDLYTEIWSDQPPVFTALLAGWLAIFDDGVFIARLLVLGMSTALMWALFQVAHHQTSLVAALGTVVILAVSEEYLRLSVSVMIGLPSLAFVVWSAYAMVMAKSRDSTSLLISSALLMAVALQTKLMAATAVPALVVYWLFAQPQCRASKPFLERFRGLLLWILACLTTFALIGWWFGAGDIAQLLRPHLAAETRAAFANTQNSAYLRHAFLRHGFAVVLALVGVLAPINWRRRQLLLPLVWLGTSTLLLLLHRPLWHHHVTLITVPLVWLSAFGVHAAANAVLRARAALPPGKQSLAAGLGIILAISVLLILAFYPDRLDRVLAEETYRALPNYQGEIAAVATSVATQRPGMMLTDRPFYAFQAGVLVPPPTAAFTRKRIEAGELSPEQILDAIRTYNPEQLLFERFVGSFAGMVETGFGSEYCGAEMLESVIYVVRMPCNINLQ